MANNKISKFISGGNAHALVNSLLKVPPEGKTITLTNGQKSVRVRVTDGSQQQQQTKK